METPTVGTDHVGTSETLYLDLLKKCLTRYMFPDTYRPLQPKRGSWTRVFFEPMRRLLATQGLMIARRQDFDPEARAEGRDWPVEAETMIGLKRLDNLEFCITDILRRRVPGDLLEAGVWRGGAAIFMKGVLEAYQDHRRVVWLADSYEGLPRPDPNRYPLDAGDPHWTYAQLASPLEEVKANFARYELLDDRVRFLAGWFRDTLPAAPVDRLALLRADADMYESTMDILSNLYFKVSIGGYVIIDDFDAVPACKEAVCDFREQHGISETLERADWASVYWRRER